MIKRIRGFTLIELLVVVGIIALLISILLPSLARARELSKRTACQASVKSIGTSCFIYQEDNLGVFPTAPHRTNTGASPIIEYMGGMGGVVGISSGDRPRDEQTQAGSDGDLVVANSRNLWLLVRSGAIVPKNFKCPSSEDVPDPTPNVADYFDFVGFGSISYGYQVPTDQANSSKPTVDAVNMRFALVADRGPWTVRGETFTGTGIEAGYSADACVAYMDDLWTELKRSGAGNPGYRTDRSPPDVWKPFNSPNHGGDRLGEGENVLYPDMHVEWSDRPTAGADGDNIYTRMDPSEYTGETAFNFGLFWGSVPPSGRFDAAGEGAGYYPGDGSLGYDLDSTTDSLIYP